MLKETVEIKVDYEKAGVSGEGCAPVLDCYYNTLTEEIGRKKHKAIIICPGGGYDWCSDLIAVLNYICRSLHLKTFQAFPHQYTS